MTTGTNYAPSSLAFAAGRSLIPPAYRYRYEGLSFVKPTQVWAPQSYWPKSTLGGLCTRPPPARPPGAAPSPAPPPVYCLSELLTVHPNGTVT